MVEHTSVSALCLPFTENQKWEDKDNEKEEESEREREKKSAREFKASSQNESSLAPHVNEIDLRELCVCVCVGSTAKRC